MSHFYTHSIHGTGIFPFIYHKIPQTVGKDTVQGLCFLMTLTLINNHVHPNFQDIQAEDICISAYRACLHPQETTNSPRGSAKSWRYQKKKISFRCLGAKIEKRTRLQICPL